MKARYNKKDMKILAEIWDRKKDMRKHVKKIRDQRRLRRYTVDPEDLETFFQEAPNLIGVLGDENRLRILKTLQQAPHYQSELSEATNVVGGSFKHHMDKLRDANFVIQEAVRGRYLITQSGREALALSEMMFIRHNPERFESYKIDDENTEEEEDTELENDEEDQEFEENELIDEDDFDDDFSSNASHRINVD